jgi:hypothetical protein
MSTSPLLSPYEKTGDLFYFPRMLGKIRLHAEGQLPAEYHPNLGIGFDGQCTAFLGVEYRALVERVHQGGSDQEILRWCFEQGRKPSQDEIQRWNELMRKRGWNDDGSPTLKRRLREGGWEDRTDIQTFFDFIDLDEGRPLHSPFSSHS